MAGLRFKIVIRRKGWRYFERMLELLRDLSAPFNNIINDWAKHNREKFSRARGAELTGMTQAADLSWYPVSEKYWKSKHGANAAASIKTRKLLKRTMKSGGYADWLMVRSGDLMNAMSTPEAFARYVSPTTAVFGTPFDPEDAAKVAGNWMRRQVIFLALSDKRMIHYHIQDYLNYGEDYMGARSDLSRAKNYADSVVAEFKADFKGTMA